MSTAREVEKNKAAPVEWSGAPRGMIKNAPQADLPSGAVASVTNAICYPTEWRPRNGTRIVACPKPPALSGRTGYTASKTGNLITASTDIFTAADISRYWVWPGNPDQHDEIQVYVNARQVRVGTTGDKSTTNGCWMHSRLNLWRSHRTANRMVFQWGTEVYLAEIDTTAAGVVSIVRRTKCVCRSVDSPWDVESTWDERDKYGVIFNPGGTFILDFDHAEIWKSNTPVPQTLLESNTRDKERERRYCYIYGMAKIAGAGLRNRTTPGAAILQQSGSTKLQGDVGFERDYCDKWTGLPIGDGTRTTGKLTGGAIDDAYTDPSYWTGLGEDGGSFMITVNDVRCEFSIDFSVSGYNVTSINQVAEAIQKEIRSVFPFATCEYVDGRFVFTAGDVDGSTVNYGESGTSGTDIGPVMKIRQSDGAVLNNSYQYEQDTEVGVFSVPYRENSLGEATTVRERHWTHYVVIRSEDIGQYGVNPRVNELTGELLNPVFFSWAADVRVAGAFFARKEDGIIEAVYGEFELADEGTSFEWEDGDVDTLGTYIDSKHMRVRGGDYYYDDDKPLQAGAIGGGRVIRAYQNGRYVYRVSGETFASLTEGDTIFAADGAELVVSELVDANTVKVTTWGNKDTMGFTCCPTERVINDFTPDETLRARQGDPIVGFWEYRFYKAMPGCGIGIVVPGFVITAKENDNKLYYCQLRMSEKYMLGYHLPNRQMNDRIVGAITGMRKTPNKFIVWCRDSTWGGPTNMSDSNIKRLEGLGQSYAVIYADVLNERIGVVDVGSIAAVADGIFMMRCQDGSFRMFDGTAYSDDLTMDAETRQDKIRKDFGNTWPQSASIYSSRGNLGHILWCKQKA